MFAFVMSVLAVLAIFGIFFIFEECVIMRRLRKGK